MTRSPRKSTFIQSSRCTVEVSTDKDAVPSFTTAVEMPIYNLDTSVMRRSKVLARAWAHHPMPYSRTTLLGAWAY